MDFFLFPRFSGNDNDAIRIAAGTAVTQKISDEECDKLFGDNSGACIVDYGEPVLHGEDALSPESKAAKEANEAERKRSDERNQKLYEERTQEYWNRKEANETSSIENMTAKIIECSKRELLDITLDEFLSQPVPKRRRIDTSVPSTLFNSTVLTTADMNTPQQPGENSQFEEESVSEGNEVESEEEIEDEVTLDASAATADDSNVENVEDANDSEEEPLNQTDATVEYGEEEEEEVEKNNASLSERRSFINQQKPKFFNSTNSRHVLVLLRNKLYFNGHVHLTLIAGKARTFGYNLIQDKRVEVHSPKGFSLIFVEPLAISDDDPIGKGKTIDEQLSRFAADFLAQDIDYLLNNFNSDSDALILLERNRDNNAVHMTERYMKETFAPNINSFNSDNYYYSSEFMLHCRLSFRPRSGLNINSDWDTVKVADTSKVFVIGGKGVGKSTLLRYLINSNLAKCGKFLLIDLDIGQPEVFLPQTVSATVITEPILGPGFLLNVKPAKSFLYGDINVLPSPMKYLKCVLALHAFCANDPELSGIPWIVNTMGYTRGLGDELICSILKIFQPTDVIQIQGQQHRDNFEQSITTDVVNDCPFTVFKNDVEIFGRTPSFRTHLFRSVAYKDKKNPIAKDIRYAMVLSKLGGILKSNSDWLSTVKPFKYVLIAVQSNNLFL